jgi:hypothetical protein
MCAYKRKTWIEKRDTAKPPQIKKVDKQFADILKGETMLIANPRMVDAYIRHIPRGSSCTLQKMREDLAAENNADKTCPVTAGIFLRIVAEAAYEEYNTGKPLKGITPFWRILSTDAPTAKKLSFGTALLERERNKEGLDHKTKKKKYARISQ